MEPPNHLIVVCGHAIWAGGPTKGQDESEWIIEDWKNGETPTYAAHVKAGVKALSEDDRAMLVFSGAPTVPSIRLSEGRSYATLAAANNYWNLLGPASSATSTSSKSPSDLPLLNIPLHPRILVEERALDSYQNILFSIIHFWRSTSHWPSHLTIVSHQFKRRRLTEAHCTALSFPLDHVRFIGINPPGVPEIVGREEDAVAEWIADPQGMSENLRAKRQGRNCWDVAQTLFLDDEERVKSGIETRLVNQGSDEVLVEGALRPWGRN
ncbi:hypothetical protein VPNG_10052 [Cytospora leucostoma]|uniref:DUF218 domain-containing protein n=1 Tax=Cytospora leucostoma TaxID=1230097 RepID=A0A423VHT6_9PEZI|nr:hypothetical protein VPNG_10052 [Cytospora leucostoma]